MRFAINLRKEDFDMKEKLKEITKLLNGYVEVKINSNDVSVKIEGNIPSIAMIISIIENDILNSRKISYSEWKELKNSSKILLTALKENGSIKKYEK